MNNYDDIRKLADHYGQLKAAEAEVQERIATVKEMILETDLKEIEGTLFKVVVSEFNKTSIDTNSLKQDYPELVKKYEKISNIISLRCYSR
jgi:predicted phage-related endonuclease